MAYAAVISLKRTIERLVDSSKISVLPESEDILIDAYNEAVSLQNLFLAAESQSSSSRNAFYGEIRDAARELEYALESHVLNQILSRFDTEGHRSFLFHAAPPHFIAKKISYFIGTGPMTPRRHRPKKTPEDAARYVECRSHSVPAMDMGGVKQEIICFTEMMKNKLELLSNNPLAEEEKDDDDDDDVVSSRVIDFGGIKSKMVGMSDEISRIKDMLAVSRCCLLRSVSLLGMAGIGKTTVALEICEDPSTLSDYELRAFVKVGPKYKFRQIMVCILAQMNYDLDELNMEQDETLSWCLRRTLEGRRYLIVMDDLWTRDCWDELDRILPNDYNGSRVLVTTRLEKVASSTCGSDIHKVRFLNRQESWNLLREKVFGGDELCPYEFEKVGRKIAENCDGLPLTVVTVARLLSEVEKTLECWNNAAEKGSSVFKDAHDEMSEVFFLSFKYLRQYLKACFLYMGIFPENCEIPVSKLINLWIVEGFIEPFPSSDTLENFAKESLAELVSNTVVLVHKQRFGFGETKTCSLHSTFWNFCMREAGKEKLFHIINSYANISTQDMKGQQRLCIHNNVVFGIKEVYDIMESISTVHSLLCTGPHHQYPIPIRFCLRLLRVLDAHTIRFYEFPIEVVRLVQLTYLALTSNAELPPSISKLWNLEYLIVHRHMSIKSSRAHPYLPMDIWDMQELKHLEVIGSDLLEPDPSSGAFLPGLSTLLGVSPRSCAKGVLERLPNLKKLGIQIELAPDDDAEKPLSCLDHSFNFNKLASLKYVVVNPNPMSRPVAFPTSFVYKRLGKLTLSGLGYPWERMRTLPKLSNLDVLKLQNYAFCGPKWETCYGEFFNLKYLLLEDTDLEHWEGGNRCFINVQHVIIRHCYKLKEIPFRLEHAKNLKKIELVDCPLAVAFVKKLQEGRRSLQVSIKSSWEGGKRKS